MASGPWQKARGLHQFLEEANLLTYEHALLQQGVDNIQQLRQMGERDFQQLCSMVGIANDPFHLRRFARALGRRTLPHIISGGSTMSTTCSPSSATLPTPPSLAPQQSSVAMFYLPFTVSSSRVLSHSPSTNPPAISSSSLLSSSVRTTEAHTVPISFHQHLSSAPQGTSSQQPSPNVHHFVQRSTLANEPVSLESPLPSFQPYVPVSVGEQTKGQSPLSCPSTSHSVPALRSTLASPRISDSDKKIFLPPYLRPESQGGNFDELIDGQTPIQKELGPPPFTPGTWDPQRAELIRKHSAIYGQNTNKRKTGELSAHEENVNEAAYQLCLRDPTLLVRRDELFILARRAVKKGGYVYTHHHKCKAIEAGSSQHIAGTKRPLSSRNPEEVSEAEVEEEDPDLTGETKILLREKRLKRLGKLESLIASNKQEQSVKLAALDQARQSNDFALAYQLQLEVESLGNKCHDLQAEFSVLKKNQRRSAKYFEGKHKGKEEQKGTQSSTQSVTTNFCTSVTVSCSASPPVYTSPDVGPPAISQSTPAVCPDHTSAALEFERKNASIFPIRLPSKSGGLLASAPFSQAHQLHVHHGYRGTDQTTNFNPFHQ